MQDGRSHGSQWASNMQFFFFFGGGLGEEKLNLNPKDVFDFRKVGKNKFKPT